MTTRCAPPDCTCDCHVPPRPEPREIASPELIAMRKREALAAIEHARLRRTTATEETA